MTLESALASALRSLGARLMADAATETQVTDGLNRLRTVSAALQRLRDAAQAAGVTLATDLDVDEGSGLDAVAYAAMHQTATLLTGVTTTLRDDDGITTAQRLALTAMAVAAATLVQALGMAAQDAGVLGE